jgi:hypothetical protein
VLAALRHILERQRLQGMPVVLSEDKAKSRCEPTPLRHRHEPLVLRLHDEDFLKLLRGDRQMETQSFRKLPDYLIFSAPAQVPRSPRDISLRVLLCELKSGELSLHGAVRQLQLGRLLADYLLRVALFSQGQEHLPGIDWAGLILTPELPSGQPVKGATRAGPPPVFQNDQVFRIPVYLHLAGTEVHLDRFFAG